MTPRVLWCAVVVATGLHAQLADQVRARLAELREEAGFPGITAGIVLADGSRITAAAGLDPAARMPAGSTGKTFCAAAILQTVDESTLHLDSRIERYLDEEEWFDRLPNAREITLRILLNHRSGIDDFAPALTTNIRKNWTALELVANLFDKKPLFPADAGFAYADANFVLAGLIFEGAVGRSLFAEIERRILKPFDLHDTVSADARGGIISTAGDLARWAKLLWEGRAFSRRLLDQVLNAKPAGADMKYGLAVQVQPSEFGVTYGHAGLSPGYQTEMVYFPEHKIAIAVQVNTDPLPGKRTPRSCLNEIMRVVLGSPAKTGNR